MTIDNIMLSEVCKLGHGVECCRFLVMHPEGFGCAKLTSMRAELDNRVFAGRMTAVGDNCAGIETS